MAAGPGGIGPLGAGRPGATTLTVSADRSGGEVFDDTWSMHRQIKRNTTEGCDMRNGCIEARGHGVRTRDDKSYGMLWTKPPTGTSSFKACHASVTDPGAFSGT